MGHGLTQVGASLRSDGDGGNRRELWHCHATLLSHHHLRLTRDRRVCDEGIARSGCLEVAAFEFGVWTTSSRRSAAKCSPAKSAGATRTPRRAAGRGIWPWRTKGCGRSCSSPPSAPSRSESGRKLEGQERQFGLFSAYPAVGMTAEEDIERVAEHLADLTRTVEAMATQLQTLSDQTNSQQERVESQQQRTEVQQERIDLAARELADVSERLQAAANALRESISAVRPASSVLSRSSSFRIWRGR